MARRKVKSEYEVQIDEEVGKMSEEELRKHFDGEHSAEKQAKFDSLVRARDEAQEAVHAHTYRNFAINMRLHELLQKRRKDEEAA
jgi:hypothetical protein